MEDGALGGALAAFKQQAKPALVASEADEGALVLFEDVDAAAEHVVRDGRADLAENIVDVRRAVTVTVGGGAVGRGRSQLQLRWRARALVR